MNEILNKEPVERVRKKLEEFDKSLKIVLLESTARTAIDAAKSLNNVNRLDQFDKFSS